MRDTGLTVEELRALYDRNSNFIQAHPCGVCEIFQKQKKCSHLNYKVECYIYSSRMRGFVADIPDDMLVSMLNKRGYRGELRKTDVVII